MEEGVGFEPTDEVTHSADSFQDCSNNPGSGNLPKMS